MIRPLLVAAVLAGTAVAVAVATRPGHAARPPRGSISSGPAAARRATAITRARATLDHAPVPPGAVAGVRSVNAKDSASFVSAAQDWTTTDSRGRVLAYLRAHPPAGLARRPGDRTIVHFSNHRDTRSLHYEFTAGATGLTIHVYAYAVWTPVRPSWSYLHGTVTSVDVVVVRGSYDPDFRAPTVRRTLTGDPARRLAGRLNSLAAQRPALCHSAGPWDYHTTLLFHTDRQQLNVGMSGNCENQAAISRPGDRRDDTLVAGVGLSNAALHALGLPSNYGFGAH